MPPSSSLHEEKKQWWLSNRKVVGKYVKNARSLIATQEPSHVQSALGLLDAALALLPRHEAALELKARSLLYLRRFRDVADMLQDYIPSYKGGTDVDDSSTSLSSDNSSSSSSTQSQQLSREKAKLLPSLEDEHTQLNGLFRCFSVADLKRKMIAGLFRNGDKEGHWSLQLWRIRRLLMLDLPKSFVSRARRYMVLGKACSHLGMMEDAMVLLQTGRRLATAASRRESSYLSDDDFSLSSHVIIDASCAPSGSAPSSNYSATANSSPPTAPTESESAAHLLSHIKFLLRRRAAAVAALDAGLPAESVRHFSKILDNRRGTPHAFAAGCLVGRAVANRAAGRIAESIADCNRALALDPTSIPALRARADLLDSVRSYPDCLRDLDHLKLLYDAILRDGKLPGPAWRPYNGLRYRNIADDLRKLTSRIQEMRQSMAGGETSTVNYYSLIGVWRGCTRSDLERAHLLLSLKHRPDKAASFIDRLELADEHRDIDAVRDQAKMSALMLYRLLQKGYSSIMSNIMDEEAEEKQRLRKAAALQAAVAAAVSPAQPNDNPKAKEVGCPPPQAVPPEKPEAETKQGDFVEEAAQQKLPAARPMGTVTTGHVPPDAKVAVAAAASVFQGVFCRDLSAVGNLLSQVGFNRTIPVKYEALSC